MVLVAACATPVPPTAGEPTRTRPDSQHAGITTPHGDHADIHGGMVLMNGDLQPLSLGIDDSGESWVASGQPIAAGDVTVKVNYLLRGQQFEIEIPFTVPAS